MAVGNLDNLVIWIWHKAFKNFPDVYYDVSLSPRLYSLLSSEYKLYVRQGRPKGWASWVFAQGPVSGGPRASDQGAPFGQVWGPLGSDGGPF